jgi:hypothetical protein
MAQIDLQEILFRLGPNSGYGLIWNILIYIVAFFTLVTLLLQGDKALITTIISAIALLCCLLAKLAFFDELEFGTLITHAGMFLLPALVAGMTRSGKSRAPAVLASVMGGVYFFAFWFFFQFGS